MPVTDLSSTATAVSSTSPPRAPVVRVVTGELVATRRELMPLRRAWIRVPARRVSWGRVALRAAGVLGGLAVVAGVVWLVVKAVLSLIAEVLFVVAWVQAHLLVIGVAAVIILLVLFLLSAGSGRSSCAGLHCGGCRR